MSSSNSFNLFLEASRTVRSVHSQFVDLKKRADEMGAYAATLDRNYFTPTEDEAVRHVLINYWQLRVALLEVVNELRSRGSNDAVEYDRLFLPGYAGALVLVDAARFIRDRFHRHSLIRHKLNEPEPSFGIPAGVYDATQKSWTRPSHIWQLFEAARYFHLNQPKWKDLSDQPEVQSMLEIIEQLSSRLQMSWGDYAKVRMRFRLRQFGSLLKRNVLRSSLFQLQKLMGTLAADRYLKLGHQPGLPEKVRSELGKVLVPGDILLVRKEYALTNYFLPGYWPHSALYLGDVKSLKEFGFEEHSSVAPRWKRILQCDSEEKGRVIEAMKDGVHVRPMESPYRSDSILVLRPKLERQAIQFALARALFHEGKEYDFSFDFTVADRLVCTEVIYRAFDGVEGISFPLAMRAGRMTLAAAELVQMGLSGTHFEIAATYIPNLSPEIQCKQQAHAMVASVGRS